MSNDPHDDDHQQQQEDEDDTQQEEPESGPRVLCNVVSSNEAQPHDEAPGKGVIGSVVDRATRATSCIIAAICGARNHFAQKWPRLFHLTFRVLVPCLGLIGVSFFCGYFLARAESGLEMSNNDARLVAKFNTSLFYSSVAYGNYVPDPCLANFNVNDPVFNATGFSNFLEECGEQLWQDSQGSSPLTEKLAFDWIVCGDDGESLREVDQFRRVMVEWTEDYFHRVATLATQGNKTFQEAYEMALDQATGHRDCTIHTAAGALFWFTIMTTMGYGNTAPVTTTGRALIYTLGFVSILLFGAIIGSAGSICLVVFDDFALRRKAKWLTKGVVAPIFWLAVLCLWVIMLGVIFMSYEKNRDLATDLRTLADSFWFAYISITTVGLGDFYIRPDLFRAQDMFFIPFLFLLGFVLMANFLFKFTEWVTDILPHHGPTLEEILEERRNPNIGGDSQTSLKPQDSSTEPLAQSALVSPQSMQT